MSDETKSIEQDIRRAKARLGEQLSAAEDKARAVTDWKTHYRRNPAPALLAAAAVGFIAGARGRGSAHSDAPRHLVSGAGGVVNSVIEKMIAAFVAAAAVKASQYIEGVMPGFDEEFRRRA